jgi:hypothetical protein
LLSWWGHYTSSVPLTLSWFSLSDKKDFIMILFLLFL